MATPTEQGEQPLVQMATRVPVSLLQAVKLWCVRHDVTVMSFITDAVREKLRRSGIRGV